MTVRGRTVVTMVWTGMPSGVTPSEEEGEGGDRVGRKEGEKREEERERG